MKCANVFSVHVESNMAYQKRGRWIAETQTGEIKKYATKAMAEEAEVMEGGSNAAQESTIKIKTKTSGSIGIQQAETDSKPQDQESYSSGESWFKN